MYTNPAQYLQLSIVNIIIIFKGIIHNRVGRIHIPIILTQVSANLFQYNLIEKGLTGGQNRILRAFIVAKQTEIILLRSFFPTQSYNNNITSVF